MPHVPSEGLGFRVWGFGLREALVSSMFGRGALLQLDVPVEATARTFRAEFKAALGVFGGGGGLMGRVQGFGCSTLTTLCANTTHSESNRSKPEPSQSHSPKSCRICSGTLE